MLIILLISLIIKNFKRLILFLNQNKFVNFLIESIELKEYTILNDENSSKILNFWIDFGKGRFSERYEFFISIKDKIKDSEIPDIIGQISSFTIIVKDQYETFTDSINEKFDY